MKFSAKQISEFLNGELIKPGRICFQFFKKIEEGQLVPSLLGNPKYTHHIYETAADIVIVNADLSRINPYCHPD